MVESQGCPNPFPGLRPFTVDEDYLFFGREDQAKELLRRLRKTRFLAVVGTSGHSFRLVCSQLSTAACWLRLG
jgi:Novel STAND NTPase 1